MEPEIGDNFMTIQDYLDSLSEEERIEVTNEINKYLAEQGQYLEYIPPDYRPYYVLLFMGICGILGYFGRKLYLLRKRKQAKEKLRKKIEKKQKRS